MSEAAESWTIQKVLVWSTGFLKDRGFDTPRLDAELLLGAALGLTRIQLYTYFDKPLHAQERDPFKDLLRRRAGGEPVAYITGIKEFMGHPFEVNKSVLIPRPDTEVLVETALAHLKALPEAPLRILDIGTGSGCVALALAKRHPEAEVVAWDLHEAALAVARANGAKLGVENVTFLEKDALDPEAWNDAAFDLIVSNPPYICETERPALPRSVVDFEPGSALFAAGSGLFFYETYARLAPTALNPGGTLMVEIGSTQAEAVSALFAAAGFQGVAVTKDYGKNDRVVVGRV